MPARGRRAVTEIDPSLTYHLNPAPSEEASRASSWTAMCGARIRTSKFRGLFVATEHDYLHICSTCLNRLVVKGDSEGVYIYKESNR